jgi:two-component sensor histidine kinase
MQWGALYASRALPSTSPRASDPRINKACSSPALDHRVKNLLFAKDMRQGGGSLDNYIQALDWRMQSMAGAYALLSQSRWDGVDLAELVRRQLTPHGTDANTTLDGPNITLPVAATQTLAMVLHELATNAAKYGALSTPHGRVEVSWNRGPGEDAANLSIAWREIGGPAVPASHDCRYGVSIIRDLIPQELGGSVDLAFASSGVCCNIEIPLEPARHRHTGLSAGDARSREAVQP